MALLALRLSLALALALLTLLAGLVPLATLAFALLLQITERVVGQILLITQGFGQILHRLLARGLRAVAAFTLGHAQVFHKLVQLVHQLLRFGHPAFLHQLFDPVHQGLQFIHAHRLALLAVVGHIRAIARLGLFGQHPQIIIRRLAQFLHQFGDFFVRGTVAHRLGQPFLRAAQAFAGIGKAAILKLDRKIPHRLDDFGLPLVGHAEFGHVVETPDDRAHPQIDGFAGKETFGLVRDRPQDLVHAAGVGLGPHQVAALFDHGAGQRLKETPPGQDQAFRLGNAHLPCSIRHFE